MLSFSSLQGMNKEAFILSSNQSFPTEFHSSSVFRWGLRRGDDGVLISKRKKSQAVRVLANTNESPIPSQRRSSRKEIIMVDPVEAKRLAAKQMEKVKARQRLERQRQIEAINGAWAMIGLTVGLVVEGKTGHGILSQKVLEVFQLFLPLRQ